MSNAPRCLKRSSRCPEGRTSRLRIFQLSRTLTLGSSTTSNGWCRTQRIASHTVDDCPERDSVSVEEATISNIIM